MCTQPLAIKRTFKKLEWACAIVLAILLLFVTYIRINAEYLSGFNSYKSLGTSASTYMTFGTATNDLSEATLSVSNPTGNISSGFVGIPTDTTISLRWIIGAGNTSTVIRYSTTGYPATRSDGTSVSGSAITGNNYMLTGLTAGTTYYFSAWGYNGSTYSPTAVTLVMNTASVNNAVTATGDAFPIPTFPTQWNQVPSSTGLSRFEPFYSLINSFAADWQMPQDNGWLGFILFGIAFISILVYIKVKEIFVALFVSEFLMIIGIFTLGVPAWMAAIPLVIGMGVWGIEHNFQ